MTSPDSLISDVPVVCRLPDADLRERRETVIRQLFEGALAVTDVADGIVLHLPGDHAWLQRAMDFISFERECCPFLTFDLHCDAANGPLTLAMRSSPAGVTMLKEELVPIRS